MKRIEEFVDDRQKSWCIQCGASIGSVETSEDHVPSKGLLPDDVAVLLKEYVDEHRPVLAGSEGPYLFPGRDGGPRPHSNMRHDFKEAMRKRAGLDMHPHLIRHAIAKIVVERDPGLYVAMSQHLGHKRIDMTMAHYLGTETRASARHIDSLLRDVLAGADATVTGK